MHKIMNGLIIIKKKCELLLIEKLFHYLDLIELSKI